MYLYINTINHQKVEIGIIESDEQKLSSTTFSCQYQFQIKNKLLKAINKILIKNKITLKNLDGIILANKSKEMTSLRIGISAANALAYSLNIPIIGIKKPSQLLKAIKDFKTIKKFKPIKPEYEINPMLKK